jgi:hypothetical protein
MTYLEAVNQVLIKLRESQVGSVSENTYSSLVGAFINDAKRAIEDAWQWRALITPVTVTTTLGSSGPYNLASSLNERARLYLDVETGFPVTRCTTSGFTGQRLVLVPPNFFFEDRQLYTNTFPYRFYLDSLNNSATSGQSRLRLSTISPADNAYVYEIWFVNPQNNLTSDSTVISVPSDPIIQLAYLYCLYERGEELGEQLTMTETKAKNSLSDAVALDTVQTSSDLQFTVTAQNGLSTSRQSGV